MGLQGYLAHKKALTPLGPPHGPRHSPTVGFQEEASSCEQGTAVGPLRPTVGNSVGTATPFPVDDPISLGGHGRG